MGVWARRARLNMSKRESRIDQAAWEAARKIGAYAGQDNAAIKARIEWQAQVIHTAMERLLREAGDWVYENGICAAEGGCQHGHAEADRAEFLKWAGLEEK